MIKKITIYISFFLLLCSGRIDSQDFTNHTYSPSGEVFPNPERGFYKYSERSSTRGELSLNTLNGYRADGYTLIYRIYYIGDYVNSPISAEYLDKIREDFQVVRSAGIKVVLRFAYTSKSSEPYGDATPDQVQEHISQLKPLLRENADVIAVMQAGFIGAWGEWYYTDHFATGSPDNVTPEDLEERSELVYALLDALPEERQVQLRYVGYKRDIFGEEPISAEEAYSGTPKSRIAHHNDCFVSSNNDVGTYHSFSDRTYLEQDSKYISIGGETCRWYEPRSNCDTTLVEMAKYHWSFINIDYYGTTIQNWKDAGCFDDIQRLLGYRYSMSSSSIQDFSKPGGTFMGSVTMVNGGFTNPYNPRAIEIIMRHQTTGEEYFLPLDIDLRKIPAGEAIHLVFEGGMPESIPAGNYDLFLNLPDPMLSIKRDPDYAIRIANSGTWEEASGYNSLMHTVNVDPANNVAEYTGEEYFSVLDEYADIDPDLDPAPGLFVNQYAGNAVLYWGLVEGNTKFTVIERSDNGSEYNSISLLSPEVCSYVDRGLTGGHTYQYRIYLTDNYVGTPFSNTVDAAPDPVVFYFPVIAIDGAAGDWNPVVPVITAAGTSTYSTFCFADTGSLNISIRGANIEGYLLFLETDGFLNTGGTPGTWSTGGADAMLAGDSLFYYDDGWVYEGKLARYYADENLVELAIPFGLLQLPEDQLNLRIAAQVYSGQDTVSMPFRGKQMAVYERILPAVQPAELDVTSSLVTPEEKLIVKWESCDDCKGYFLERSAGNADAFELVAILEPTAYKFNDTGLDNNTLYYYRLSSYNFAGPSAYAGPVTGYTHPLGIGQNVSGDQFTIYPNPAGERFIIRTNGNGPEQFTFRLCDLSGREVLYHEVQSFRDQTIVAVEHLPAGIYLIQLETGRGTTSEKIIIY